MRHPARCVVASGLVAADDEPIRTDQPSSSGAHMRVLVTGAASGIGRATCLRLARDAHAQGKKAQVAAVDIATAASGLDSLATELDGPGAEVLSLHGDMADPEAPARAVAAAVERFGGLDGVVSNAGINRPGRLVDYAVGDWDADVRRQHARDVASREGRLPRAEGVARRHRGGGVDVGLERPRQPRSLRTRARPPSSCSRRCSPRSSGPTASASTPSPRHGADGHDRRGLRRPAGGRRARVARAARARGRARGHGRRHRVPAGARRALHQRPRPRRRRRRGGQLPRPPPGLARITRS